MENKTQYQAELFGNRLKKKYKELRKWARKNRVSCYRIYDRDIPEVPVSLDLYEFLPTDCTTVIETARFIADQNARLSANDLSVEADIKERTYAVLYLYERPYQKEDSEEELWLTAMADSAAEVLGIEVSHIIKKFRKHNDHKSSQYEKDDKSDLPQIEYNTVQECGQLFKINLGSYLDNGLFFDHRPLRNTVRETCSNKSVLNLFCYTGSFSVYAAQGNAKSVESVDLSNTYLNWAKENMEQNGFDDRKKYIFTRADCMAFLQEKTIAQKAVISGKADADTKAKAKTYDLIILDPPTFSNSKNTYNVLDINKDWPQLVKDCLNILNPGGTLYFSTNSERLKFDRTQLPQASISGCTIGFEDITSQTIPNDYAGCKPHRCWKFTLGKI
ncbi:MAG: class I SAM-dependent methyltransferase [Spirochaetia bacterium]|nr:class I SAM-dependent methyltransferase [Spirochaetia bacterium]MDD7269558.1 class I SAM-dependent methyltransferase [Treponema sp.]MDD7269633.1 class I SAM-dependent methyltransferase [Treponema sp.]MDY4986018.1 class I SAM-dependent methyltransferase [Treponema sp.]